MKQKNKSFAYFRKGMHMCRLVSYLVVLAFVGCSKSGTQSEVHPHTNKVKVPSLSGCIDDQHINKYFAQQLNIMAQANRTAKASQLRKQLQRKVCALELPRKPATKVSLAEVHQRYKNSILIVGGRYKCGKCQNWHRSSSSGFIISSSGAFVTSYHVINDSTIDSFAIMTGNGKMYGVKEVLAADEDNDFVILQASAGNFFPLPLKAEVPVGSAICVISHPDENYYMMTEGIVARYFAPPEYQDPNVVYMTVTADFAKGSSGGPIIDQHGCVVGVVSYTKSAYYDEGKKLQMVFKHATIARAILKSIRSPKIDMVEVKTGG